MRRRQTEDLPAPVCAKNACGHLACSVGSAGKSGKSGKEPGETEEKFADRAGANDRKVRGGTKKEKGKAGTEREEFAGKSRPDKREKRKSADFGNKFHKKCKKKK